MAGKIIKNYKNTICKDCAEMCIIRDQGLIISKCVNYVGLDISGLETCKEHTT